jgi:competence ComEA-like helix-hairpin-helix protein
MTHSPDWFERGDRGCRPVPFRVPAWTLGAAAVVLAASIGARAMTPHSGGLGAAAQAPGERQNEEAFAVLGEKTTEKACLVCHPWENIVEIRRTLTQWDEVVANMAQRGAPATPDELTIVTTFLARYYGLVHVNAASAEEFSTVLGLSAKDAQAIVGHRKAHGKFADAAALASVEGIDKQKIEEQLDALIFN